MQVFVTSSDKPTEKYNFHAAPLSYLVVIHLYTAFPLKVIGGRSQSKKSLLANVFFIILIVPLISTSFINIVNMCIISDLNCSAYSVLLFWTAL